MIPCSIFFRRRGGVTPAAVCVAAAATSWGITTVMTTRFHLNDDPHRLKLRLRIGVFCWRRPEVLLKETTHHQDCD
ncbi:hypothetical protein AGIG_G10016 [Arapaima gigas]